MNPCAVDCKEEPLPCREPLCKPRDCRLPVCDSLSAEEIFCRYKDAIVTVNSEFILIGANAEEPINSSTPLEIDVRADYILEGNGFFIEGKYIVTSSQLVLLPPALNAVVNRYPYYNNQVLGTTGTAIQDIMVRASRIFVTVHNVNNNGKSFIYEATLVGVDGAGDIALLKLDHTSCWNKTNPAIERCHPHLSFGTSRSSLQGEPVYILGNSSSEGTNVLNYQQTVVEKGLLVDSMFSDPKGNFLQELLLVSADSSSLVGSPILNAQGYVVGMKTINQNNSTVSAGPSEYFMRPIILDLIKGICSPCDCHLEIINDPLGSYYRYKKSYLGVAYNVASGVDYDYTTNFISGLASTLLPRIRLDDNGDFLNSPQWKEIGGIRVLGLAGLNPSDSSSGISNGAIYVPGGNSPDTRTYPLPFGIVSPLRNLLNPGDIITHIAGVEVGNEKGQVAPGLITWRLCPGKEVEVCFRRGGNASNILPNDQAGNYTNLFSEIVTLGDFPKYLDYPFYTETFPRIFNKFDFSGLWVTTLSDDSVIQFITGAVFKPSI